jgi:manganese-dependent ADP-ribose/CDP-alcohol diphosphatase
MQRLGLSNPSYRALSLPHGWLLLVLDTTEISGHSGFTEGSWQWKEARAYEAANPLSPEAPHMSSWNGGLSSIQLEWLRSQLQAAQDKGEKVIVASHHQFGFGAARDTHLAWNYRELSEVCLSSRAFKLALAVRMFLLLLLWHLFKVKLVCYLRAGT